MLGATIEVNGIKKHTWNDLNLKWYHVEISSPAPKTNYVDVPGMDGQLDLSQALSNEVNYNNRTIKLTFEVIGNYEKWQSASSEIMNFLHGRQAKIILDTDPMFYYIGRFELTSTKEDYLYGELVIAGDIEPYKYETSNGLEPWNWDTFNFESGIIREYKDITVNSTLTLNIYGRRKTVYPTIKSSSNMTMTLNNIAYEIKQGSFRYLEVALTEGDNILTFTGNGTISIDYRGGSL